MQVDKTKKYCKWVNLNDPEYTKYHDCIWSKKCRDDDELFLHLVLETQQSGLSFATVFKKKSGYLESFYGLDPVKIAKMSDKCLETLIDNPKIIRAKGKIFAVRSLAIAFLNLQQEYGSFLKFLEDSLEFKRIAPASIFSTINYLDNIKKTLKILKKNGVTYLGDTSFYAFLEASGFIFNHAKYCHCSWHVYIVKSASGKLYTGISNDVAKRFATHTKKLKSSAKALRGETKLELVYKEFCGCRSLAAKIEHMIKSLSKVKKLALINKNLQLHI